ncbi:general secretion pathway protein GspB [Solimonas flava]|uniref:general secretion pathway protein GspB n=1 Tax=Solimonas flava TaxID=415849 RepID=UPI0004269E8A|nr:general secretion pathway protein GspB [Solimonas flava]
MSYILEALRRAERERQMGKAPSVESLTQGGAAGTPAGVPWRIWLLAGSTAAIAIAALALLLWPAPQPAPAPEDTGTVAAAPPAAPAPAPVPSATLEPPPAVQADTPPLPAAIEDDGALASLDDVAEPEPKPAAEAAPLQPQDLARAPEPAAAPAPAPAPAPTTVLSGTAPSSGATVVPAGVTVLREMPEAYRAQFPVAALDVHVYDADPARRWVMVAGKRYREGETLASGPLIERIVENGVIFDYGGARVLLPVR